MKIVLAFIAATAFILGTTSCDKHSWSSTETLHEGMHKAHGDDHAAPGAHAKDDAHAPAKH